MTQRGFYFFFSNKEKNVIPFFSKKKRKTEIFQEPAIVNRKRGTEQIEKKRKSSRESDKWSAKPDAPK